MGAPFLSETELTTYIETFKKNGFTGPLNWYRNLRQNWLDTSCREDLVEVPALMISAVDDYFLPPETTCGMERYVPDLERQLIQDCGHWTQQEQPETVNSIVQEWLERRIRPLAFQ